MSTDFKKYMDEDGMITADVSVMTKPENAPDKITNKDLMKSWFRWWWANEVPHTYDRMLAPSFLFGMMPILKKLYKDDVMRAEAYQRHLMFFNTQAVWGGGTLTGIASSLEEERAKALHEGRVEEAVDVTMINNTKVGLMGPLAGIGDAIDSGTVQYIFIAIFLPWAQSGSGLGAVAPFLFFSTVTFIYGFFFTKMGYNLGRSAAKEIMTGEKMKSIINALGVLGLFMMGIMAGQYVKVSSSLAFTINQKEFIIQEILDKILPGLLPLATVLALYLYFDKKGLKITRGMIYLTVVLVVLALVGIL
ncbi:PTS system mannose/fructose/sorbose family transporter subunit IID [Breznakia pachnodae]|jgi:PTS system mannose-specific IID component|uniref:PTS system mannose-specific IID component n=1 Tax=Breznakia pachnodae TaxID=265178 RepID=A0ABU0DZ24_9FIRM|nr:PTS system mannose/fructose/sorbose family transporter subunit IID [Breznakia pachnodae]MDQ0359881.1 PTS system mannose-specific IID component [Breznakia pachnodae]